MRRLARRLWVPAVLAAAAAVAQEPPADAAATPAAPVRIEQVTFIPARFTVGDPVELQVVLVGLPAGFEGGSPRPAATAAAPLAPIVIDAVAPVVPLAGGRHLLRVSFRSFQPGVAALPAVALGGGVLVELPEARTAATLPDGVGQLEPARGPLPLPGTAPRLMAVIAVVLAAPAAAAFGARRARARVLEPAARRRTAAGPAAAVRTRPARPDGTRDGRRRLLGGGRASDGGVPAAGALARARGAGRGR